MLHTPIKFVAFNTNEQILRILVRILKRGASWECSGIAQIEQVQCFRRQARCISHRRWWTRAICGAVDKLLRITGHSHHSPLRWRQWIAV